MIISLHGGGMMLRDIQFHLASTIGTEVSHETISKIVDEISDEVLSWQRRPLELLYPVIYLDAMIVKVKDVGHTRNKAAHIAVGVDMAGVKHVLGIWVLRRSDRVPGGDRSHVVAGRRADLRGAPDPQLGAVRVL